MSEMTINAPAKLNLSLEIVGKREDGFHELDTLMIPVKGLHDTLTFTVAGKYALRCDDSKVPTDESNLVTKAVRLFEQETGCEVTHEVLLTKRIPHGAGLGGGSSDAAKTLEVLNELYGTSLPLVELHDLCSKLGSDVPFFLYNSPCRCKGRGEEVEVIDRVEPFGVCLLKPDFPVSTPDVYKRWSESKPLKGISYSPQEGPYGMMVNHLELPVFEKYLFLAECKRWLLDQPEVKVAQMSGSGSTMFAILQDVTQSEALILRARNELDPNFFAWSGVV